MRNAARLLLLAGLALVVSTWRASADTVWDVNATFSYDGLTNNASGSFTLDSSLDLVTWNLMVDGTNTPADNDYTTGDSIAIYPDQTHLDFYDGGTNQYIDLYFASPLSTAGGTINLLYGDGGESSDSTIVCDGCGTLVSGNVSTLSAVPEPSSIAVCLAGMLALILFSRRRIRVNQPVAE